MGIRDWMQTGRDCTVSAARSPTLGTKKEGPVARAPWFDKSPLLPATAVTAAAVAVAAAATRTPAGAGLVLGFVDAQRTAAH